LVGTDFFDQHSEGLKRALVITAEFPPLGARSLQPAHRRLRMFMAAFDTICPQIDMLYVVPQTVIAEYPDQAVVQREVSAFYGRTISVEMIPRRERATTFYNHYVSGVFSSAEQPEYYACTGPDQLEKIKRYLDLKPDIVVVQQFSAMCALLRTGQRPRNLFVDLDNIDHSMRFRWIMQPPFRIGKLGYLAQLPAIFGTERHAAWVSRLMFVCSETDRLHMRRLGFGRNVVVAPNAVKLPSTASPLPHDRTVMLLGSCEYPPNAEAAERLVRQIMPRVRERVPDARLLLAGLASDDLPSAREKLLGVEHLGTVADLDRLYARSRIICCPLTNGGGTRNKLIEAAAYGRAMVSTRVGAEGLDFVDGVEIILKDDDDALAEACVKLLQDDALCQRLGTAAREKASRLYDAATIQENITRMMRERLVMPGDGRDVSEHG
jgi:hypothetical protein